MEHAVGVSTIALSPRSLAEACELLASHPRATPIAGGTDVMVEVNDGRRSPDQWLALCRVGEMQEVERSDRMWVLGAAVTFGQILRQLGEALPALAQAARTVGGPQIRSRATLGGNLATGSPAGDSLPVLACYDTDVVLRSVDGYRVVALSDFLLGPKRTALERGELIACVRLRSTEGAQMFAKVGTRNAMVIAICSLAARLDVHSHVARVAVGSAGPVVTLVSEAEPLLLDPASSEAFAEAVVEAASPIDDVRSTAAYRRHALAVLARRAHSWLWQEVSHG